MMPRPDPVPSDPELPKRVSVVVIGGGIAGTSTALALAQKGVSVALCEKGEIGAEQSGRNWGWVRVGNRDPREVPLMIESKRIWRSLNETVEGETGYLVPPRTPCLLAQRTLDVLALPDRGRAMGAAGAARVGGRFDVAEMVSGIDAVYAECLSTKGMQVTLP